MTHQTTTYNNSGNINLPSGIYPEFNRRKEGMGKVREVRRFFFLLFIMMMMGVGSAWAQDPVFSQWGGTVPGIPANTNKTTVNNAGIKGDGTSDSPYLIKNADDFAFFWAASYNGKITSSTQYWRLEANIDLNNKLWATYIEKNGTFKGKFDGNGKIIKNMTLVPTTANKNYGLFCMVEGQAADNRAEVKNLTIDNATIAPGVDLAGNTGVGFVVGKTNKYADIVNVKVTNSTITYANNITGYQYVGGIVGQTNTDTKVQNCSVTTLDITTSGTTTNAYFGGLIGHVNSQTSITNCSTSDVTITYNTIANASRISGFIGYAKGTSEAAPTTINKCTVSGTTIDLTQGINTSSGSYIGALVGQVLSPSVKLGDGTDDNKNTVTSPSITVDGNIATASYIGGAIGDFAGAANNMSKIDGLTVNSPSVTINKVGIKECYIGAVFGRISTYTGVNNITVSHPVMTYYYTENPNVSLYLGSLAGGIAGNANQETAVTNVTVNDKAQLTIGTTANIAATNISNVKAGLVGQLSTYVSIEKWTVKGSEILVNGNLLTSASYLGGLAGYITTGCKIKGECSIENPKIDIKGNVGVASYIGGAIGDFLGSNGNTSSIKDLTVTSPSITINNYSVVNSQTGGVFGRVYQYTTVDGVNLTGASMSFTEDILVAQQIGTFAGTITGNATQQISVKNVTIDKSDLTFGSSNTSNTTAIKAGIIGQVSSNVLLDTWKVTGNSSITVNGNLNSSVFTTKETADVSRLGGFIGYMVTAASAPDIIKNIEIGGKSTINVTGKVDIKAAYLGGVLGYTELANSATSQISMDNIEVKGTTSIDVTGGINTGSYLGGFAGYVVGRAYTDCSIKLDNITLASSSINVGGEVKATSYFGGLAGNLNTCCSLTKWKITNSADITLGDITTAASYVGGAIGNINGASGYNSNIDDLTIGSPSVTVNKISIANSYIGAVFGRINTYCDVIKTINVSNPTLTYKYTDNTINVALYFGTIAGGIFGVAAQKLDMTGVTITGNAQLIVGDATNATTNKISQIRAGLIGQASTNVTLDTWEVTGNTSVTVNGNLITGTSYIGGFVGYGATVANGPLSIQNITMKGNSSVSVTGSVSDKAAYLGGFAGYAISTTNAPVEFKTIAMSGDNTVVVSGDINVGSYVAGFAGQVRVADKVSNAPITIDGIRMSDGKITSVSVGGIKAASYVSGFIGNLYSVASGTTYINDDINVSNVTIGKVAVSTGGIDVGSTYVSGLVGYANVACILNNLDITSDASITIGGNISATSYIGGAFSNLTGNAAFPSSATGIDIAKPAITLNGDISGTLYLGGIAGYQTIATISESKVTDADITLNGNTSNNMYIGGAVGWMNPTAVPYSTIEKVTVKDSKIHSSGTHTYANSNKAFAVGGIVGYMEQTSTKPADLHNCLADGVDINLGGYVPQESNTSGNLHNQYQNAFVVGGVIGQYKTPQSLPQSLYYSGKIYAPFAAVGPIVGVFQTNIGAAAYAYDDYAGTNASAISASEWEKASMWIFSDYKLGLSTAVTSQSARTKNYTASTNNIDGVDYLDITPQNLKEFNSIGGIIKPSKTILPFTASGIDMDFGIYPAWNTTETTYPNYYMYYMQGINRGVCIDATDGDLVKELILSGANSTISITPNGERGFIKSFSATPSDPVDGYAWYYDGKKLSSTSNSCSVELTVNDVVGPARNVMVMGIKGGKPVSLRIQESDPVVLRVKNASLDKSTYGSQSNPYMLGGTHGADELQLLSYLSTLDANVTWEEDFVSSTHYNRAYYELESDIDLSSVADFTPISFPKSNGTGGTVSGYHQNFVFDGVFDGKSHTISGLKEGWYAGALNTADQNMGWGLFSAVGNATATAKVGDAEASNAAIKNLVIDGATLTHKTDNTSFYYPNTTNGNNCMVGVLAGIVSANTTVQNIEIRNSSITDTGSSNYSLATKGLYVGGAIGSVQAAFNATANAAANTNINHVAANVDITLAYPTFVDETQAAQVSQFNIGGIVGRYIATTPGQAAVQATLPKYTFYSGNINAEKAWISPVLAAVRHKDQQAYTSNTFNNFSKQWEGNNNTDATQLNITNAQYYNFRINGKLMTELYPKDACARGARPIKTHTDGEENGTDYDAAKYQGVNFGSRFIDTDRTTLYLLNQDHVDVYWVWDNGFPHMTDQKPNESYLIKDNRNFTANMVDGSGSSYRWQISYDGETWTDIDGTEQTQTIFGSARPKLVVAIISLGGVDYRTQVEVVDPEELHFSPYIRQTGDDASGYVLTIVWNGEEPSGILSSTYQWYHSDKTSTFGGETNSTINLSKTQLDAETGGLVWCAVTIREMGDEVITIFIKNTANVVYVNGNGYTGSDSNGSYGAGNDSNDGRTPQTPVLTIDKANSLLDGGPWEKNIIVVMGKLSTRFTSRGLNPAMLTGFWDDVDYKGVIGFSAPSDATVNPGDGPGKTALHNYVSADTKFENLIFHSEDASAGNMFLDCHGHDVWLGKGIRMENFNDLSAGHGNLDEDKQVTPEFSIVLTSTNPAHPDEAYWTRTKPQILTIESGHYGRILGGRYISNFFDGGNISGNTSHSILATAAHPAWAVINIDIVKDNDMKSADGKKTYTCDINCVIAGLTDGSIYGDYIINMKGGNVRYIVGANQGNGVISGTKVFKPIDGKSGKFGEWPNSSFFGRTIINVEQNKSDSSKRIVLNNLYAGGLGRNADKTGAVVDMYVYGHTEINMKSGTVLGNVYGGGAGGVIGINPWDPRLPYKTTAADNATNAIINGVQYGGMSEGSPLVDVIVHKIDEDGNFTSETENQKLTDTYTTVNISGGTIGTVVDGKLKEGTGNVFGGGNGFVSNMKVEDKITMQGVGSVFGTSNVNITGGTIYGSVYGGSQGDKKYLGMTNVYGQTIDHIAEMNGTVNLTVKGTEEKYPLIVGNIYGAGMGIVSEGGQEYLDIARAGNSALSTMYNKDYKTNINILIDLPESHPFNGNIYGGGQMGAVDGTTKVVIKGGTINGDVFGGGKGEEGHPDKAKVTGETNVIVDSEWTEQVSDPEPTPTP